MSHQALARKWRPRIFSEMVGQEHVLRALINALDNNRLHHAYLFSGTRGVGKTTIARILAKCLNCEQGVTSVPCEKCSACEEISQGCFVDLIEVDAASRTKVEDTRELLDNVQYAPTRGRYKVYLIDEVHMLSTSSFNALLKTLEEPPEHVKFLLATTDPQKLPVTVLSRCLQFNLKNMPAEHIVDHLKNILAQESIAAEEGAIWQIARAAHGSMRDALSLTDQAIAYGNGQLNTKDVGDMLGTIDQSLTLSLIDALKEDDGERLMNLIAKASEQMVDYQAVLAELLNTLHRIAVAQALPEAVGNQYGDRDQIMALASAMTCEQVQLYYQIALMGRKDLPINPDMRSGCEMVLLRMLAFRPFDAPDTPIEEAPSTKKPDTHHLEVKTDSPAFVVRPIESKQNIEPVDEDDVPPWETQELGESQKSIAPSTKAEPKIEPEVREAKVTPKISEAPITLSSMRPQDWHALYLQLAPGGLLQSTLSNSECVSVQGNKMHFILDEKCSALYDDNQLQKISQLLSDYFKEPVSAIIEIGDAGLTPAKIIIQQQAERLEQARISIENSPVIRELQSLFDAKVVTDSVEPLTQ